MNQKFSSTRKSASISPEIAINYEMRRTQKEMVVSLALRQQKGNVPYYFEVISAGLFKFDSLPEASLLKQFAQINCPAIIFPYVRETLADLTRRAGFPPLHLDPINFIELAKQIEKKKPLKKKRVSSK